MSRRRWVVLDVGVGVLIGLAVGLALSQGALETCDRAQAQERLGARIALETMRQGAEGDQARRAAEQRRLRADLEQAYQWIAERAAADVDLTIPAVSLGPPRASRTEVEEITQLAERLRAAVPSWPQVKAGLLRTLPHLKPIP